MKHILSILCLLIATAAHAEFGGTTPPQTSNLGAQFNVLINQGPNAIPAWGQVTSLQVQANSLGTGQLDTSLDTFGRNFIINPQGQVTQRPNATLSANTLSYGACDRWRVGPGGNLTAATGSQASTIGQASSAVAITAMTTTGASSANFRTFIEAKDAVELVNKTAYFYATVWQNTGSQQTFVVNIYSANSPDFAGASISTTQTYTAMTSIGTQSISSVQDSTATVFSAGPFSMGSCGNGIMVEVLVNLGSAVTTKAFEITDISLQIANSTIANNVARPRPYQQELALCQRYCYVITPTAANSEIAIGGFESGTIADAYIPFPVTMRAAPTLAFSGTIGHLQIGNFSGNWPVTTNPPTIINSSSISSATIHCTASTGTATTSQAAHLGWTSGAAGDFLIFNADF